MNSLDVIDISSGNKIETVEIPEKLKNYFEYKEPIPLLHEVVTAYLANQRQGTHFTKTRSEVRGGGRKPWRQKHTGRARQGTIRSPLFRKGGVVFGPKPRDYYIDVPKKKKIIAKYISLAEKIKSSDVIVINNLNLETTKTKDALKTLQTLNIASEKILLVVKQIDINLKLATRNLNQVTLNRVSDIHTYNILNHKKIVITKEAFLCL